MENSNSELFTNTLSASKTAWLITEFAKADNTLSVQNKYKRVFSDFLTNEFLDGFSLTYRTEINEIKEAYKADVTAHPMADPYIRMNNYMKVAEICESGFVIGIDKEGDPITKIDPKTQLEAYKACGEEIQKVYANDLALLKLLILANKPSNNVALPAPPTVEKPQIEQLQDNVVETTVTEITNTKKFINFD